MQTLTSLALSIALAAAPQDAEPGGSVLVRLPFQSEANLIVVDVRIGDSEPLPFVLDSGAGTIVLDRDVADVLGIWMGASRKRPKGVRDELTYRIAPSVPFRLADHEVTLSQVVVAPCAEASRMMIGRDIFGILGHAFFARHVVEVDYERRELVLHDPQKYRYEGQGTVLPLSFDVHPSKLPFATVTIESVPGEPRELEMLVDSAGGLFGTLGFGLPATIEAFVPEDAPRVAAIGATGLADDVEGSTHAVFVTRLPRVRLGPYAVDGPIVGCEATEHVDLDLFGAELLRRFHVVFDYERSRLILEPNAAYAEPPLTDHAGLLLVASADDLSLRRVLFVTPGSPADEAGLQKDDELLEINGRPSGAQSLHATRLLFFAPGVLELKVRRGDELLTTTLHARAML